MWAGRGLTLAHDADRDCRVRNADVGAGEVVEVVQAQADGSHGHQGGAYP
ncbi:hypothetical protein GALL_459830 [mine drainage metagenome]|uniref:Uncharacterized protein n=1 Tax=mine drainage metagenome TaxID=410659 RepID=A0A1J5PML6_9ZZZZ